MTLEVTEAVLPPQSAPRKFKSQYVPTGRVVKGTSYGAAETHYDDPEEGAVAPVGEKRGRGRPPKAKVGGVAPNVHPLLQKMFGGVRKESVDMLKDMMLESIQTAEYEDLSEEELEELSAKTLRSYQSKAGSQISSLKYGSKPSNLTGPEQSKRIKGLQTAKKKLEEDFDDISEEVETAKVPVGERPKGAGWSLHRSGQQRNEPHDIYKRTTKRVLSPTFKEDFDDTELESIYEGRATVANDIDAHELHLYASNHAQLHRQQIMPIIANLSKKHAKGTYDHEKAKKLWTYAADSAAKHYEKEHGGSFNAATRRATGAAMADEHADEHGWK